MARILPFLISLVLTVYALFSCIQTRSEDVRYLPKVIWVALIVVVPVAGPIAWLLLARNRGAAPRTAAPGTRPKGPVRPVAPDDDPDFLASLERYRDPRTTPLPPELRREGDSAAQPEAGTNRPEDPAGGADTGQHGREPHGKDPNGGATNGRSPGGRTPGGKGKDAKRKNPPGSNEAAKNAGQAGDGTAANGQAVTGQPGPEPEAAPESSTEADGGEGTRQP